MEEKGRHDYCDISLEREITRETFTEGGGQVSSISRKFADVSTTITRNELRRDVNFIDIAAKYRERERERERTGPETAPQRSVVDERP